MSNGELSKLIDKAVANAYRLGDDEFIVIRLPRDSVGDEIRAMKDAVASLPRGGVKTPVLVWVDFDLSTMTRDELLSLKESIESALGKSE